MTTGYEKILALIDKKNENKWKNLIKINCPLSYGNLIINNGIISFNNENDIQINFLTIRTGLTIGKLTALLFELEMKGVVRELAGGIYHLIH